ncbi:hypothetical protein [Kitasatospora phosalacinea]|uniref:Uncharacterized protein n=1 Tax=Kitasatospora phosalacinea TaxID=2065 RepID=A0ABW6GQE3_9ACTN
MTGTGATDYCAIFLQGASRQGATELVTTGLDAPADGYTVRIGDVEVDVRPNPDAGLADDFIGWSLKIDVEGRRAAVVSAASQVLRTAWTAGLKAVAAYDFEDDLPERGGYPRHR